MLPSSAAGSRPASSAVYHSQQVSSVSPYDSSSLAMSSPSASISQTSDVWLKIDQLHLNYLKSEESTAKIDIRKKLEGYIHQVCMEKYRSNIVPSWYRDTDFISVPVPGAAGAQVLLLADVDGD